MNNTIEIRLPQLDEIVEKLDAILAGLAAHAPAPVELVPAPEVPGEPEQPQEPARTVSFEAMRQKIVALAAQSQNMKDAVREIVTGYAPQVPLIPEDKFVEVWDKLEALEQKGV